jgi:hypothetical protein
MRVRDVRKITRQEMYNRDDTCRVMSINSDGRVTVRKRNGLEITVTNASGTTLYTRMNVRLIKETKRGRWSIVGVSDRKTADTVVRYG